VPWRHHLRCGFLTELGKCELARAINRDKQVEPALFRMRLSEVGMEVADWINLEPLLGSLSPVTSGKRLVPCRCRARGSDERVRCGVVGWRT
jgi:hypothetical protein